MKMQALTWLENNATAQRLQNLAKIYKQAIKARDTEIYDSRN